MQAQVAWAYMHVYIQAELVAAMAILRRMQVHVCLETHTRYKLVTGGPRMLMLSSLARWRAESVLGVCLSACDATHEWLRQL